MGYFFDKFFHWQGLITYLTILGTPMIVLNSLKVVRKLMDERSSIYSHRPLMAMKEL
jgi:hypothetical protein